jgi:glutamate carboxypeptidase
MIFASAPVMSQSNSVEASLLQAIDSEQNRARALLRESVNINSGTMNFPGVRQVGEVFRREFLELGFETRWVDGEDFDRAGHLVAQWDGEGTRVLLIGHLDTVFAIDSPFQQYRLLDNRHASGPGTTDMKGGNVVIIQALRALRSAGVLDQLSIRVILTGDEESRGQPIALATKELIDAARWAQLALGFEDGDGDPTTAVTARRGSTSWTLIVAGKPAHSSQIFRDDIGYGAIFETARILDGFRRALSGEANLTFNPGLIVGGTEASLDTQTARGEAFGKGNVIAGTTRVSGDLRSLSVPQREKAKRMMEQIVASNLPHTTATISFTDSYPPMMPSAGNTRLLAMYDEVSRDLGFGPVAAVDPRRAGAADISFTAGHVEMALDGIGLMGDGGHTTDEVADLSTLPMQTKRTALLLWRLSQKERGQVSVASDEVN